MTTRNPLDAALADLRRAVAEAEAVLAAKAYTPNPASTPDATTTDKEPHHEH
jgi:hypothetical protein